MQLRVIRDRSQVSLGLTRRRLSPHNPFTRTRLAPMTMGKPASAELRQILGQVKASVFVKGYLAKTGAFCSFPAANP